MELKLTLSDGNYAIKEIDYFDEQLDDIVYELFEKLFNESDATKEIIANSFDSKERDTFDDVIQNGNNDIDDVIGSGDVELEFSDPDLIGTESNYDQIQDIMNKLNLANDDDVVYAIIEATGTINNFEDMLYHIENIYLIDVTTEKDLGFYWVNEVIGGVGELNSNTLEDYFDYDSYGSDIAFDFYKTSYGYLNANY